MEQTREYWEECQEEVDKRVLSIYNKDMKLYDSITQKLGEQESMGIQTLTLHKDVDVPNNDWSSIDLEYFRLNGYTVNDGDDTIEISW